MSDWRIETGTPQETAANLAEARRKLEAALVMMWAPRGNTLSPWRAFYATLAQQVPIKIEPIPSVKLISPDGQEHKIDNRAAYTDGGTIYLDAEFSSRLSAKELAAVLYHELEHCVRLHLKRRADRDPLLWNIATDAVINAQLYEEGLSLPEGCVRLSDVSSQSLEEEVYERLRQESERNKQNGTGRPSGPIAGDILAEPSGSIPEEAILTAAAVAQQQAGAAPAYIEQWLEARRAIRPNWIAKLRRCITQAVRSSRSWRRLSRRSPWLPAPTPGWNKRPNRIGIVLDTSGSMTESMLSQSLEVIRGIASGLGAGIIMWQCDADVYGPIKYEDPASMPTQWPIRGRGGTMMQPAADAVAKAKSLSLPIVLWFTDGYWCDSPALPSGTQHVCVLINGGSAPRGVRFDDVIKVGE